MDKVTQGQVSILTEYELSRAEELLPIYFQDHSALTAIRELIASHRELFKANAELSFKNQKLNDDWLKVELERHEAETRFKKIKEDYDALVSIIDRARKLAFLTEETK